MVAKMPKLPAKRGVLKRVVRRVRDLQNPERFEVTLECGHVITRTAGGRPERCYCLECSPKPQDA
jgi:hypothetical protein